MLKQRVITALLLLAVLVPSMLASSMIPFGVVSLLLISCGAWEWAKLNHQSAESSIVAGGIVSLMCLAAWWSGAIEANLWWLWLAIGLFWVLLAVWLLSRGAASWKKLPAFLRLAGGMVALVAAWLAVMQARRMGLNFLFSVLVLVWVADIGAYFAGRSLGNKFISRKLAPSISPGKTWEGVAGGVIGVLICAFVWKYLDANNQVISASLYTRLFDSGPWALIAGVLFLSAMSVVGDLLESLFKRVAGVKDSSALLPGHGGVLDRVDALLPVLPLAMALTS